MHMLEGLVSALGLVVGLEDFANVLEDLVEVVDWEMYSGGFVSWGQS